MKCLAVFLVLIGLSLAMPVGKQLSLGNLLYTLITLSYSPMIRETKC